MTDKKEPKPRTVLYLPEALRIRLEGSAADDRRSLSQQASVLIEEALNARQHVGRK